MMLIGGHKRKHLVTVPALGITESITDNYTYAETSECRTWALQKRESRSNLCGYVV